LRERNIRKVKILRITTLVLVMVFGLFWITCSVWSNIIDYTHIVKYAKKSSKEVAKRVQYITDTMFKINKANIHNYFSDKD